MIMITLGTFLLENSSYYFCAKGDLKGFGSLYSGPDSSVFLLMTICILKYLPIFTQLRRFYYIVQVFVSITASLKILYCDTHTRAHREKERGVLKQKKVIFCPSLVLFLCLNLFCILSLTIIYLKISKNSFNILNNYFVIYKLFSKYFISFVRCSLFDMLLINTA